MKSTLIPWELARVNEKRQLIEVTESKDKIKDAPTFDGDEEISPELEERVYEYFGLRREPGGKNSYGAYYRDEERRSGERYEERRPEDATTDDDLERGRGENRGLPASPGRTGAAARGARGGDVADEDELRVLKEQGRASGRYPRAPGWQRERPQAGEDRARAPERPQEARRGSRGAGGGRGPGDGVGRRYRGRRDPGSVIEEEIVVEKQPGVKEELRIRKNVVEDEEIVEEDVRKEEVESTTRPRVATGRL